ncbi:MAG: type I-E CRISPR-associated protein Cse2/CasB [Chlorobium sp.]|jgi:CRISPR system Cascade subunit CasB|nr:type I-E CRISPR-associated protein Cse2/CasB [Chlorobium sp.]
MTNVPETKTGRSLAFVLFIIERIKQNKGVVAALRRADNPATEYQCWEYLAAFHIDLEKPWVRLPFATVAAAVAKAKIEHNGSIGIGNAIARCYEDGSQSDQAKAKLRRLLACDSIEEVCRILRPLFSLIDARGGAVVDYARLLEQLLKFYWDSQRVKTEWAQEFYRYSQSSEKKEAV